MGEAKAVSSPRWKRQGPSSESTESSFAASMVMLPGGEAVEIALEAIAAVWARTCRADKRKTCSSIGTAVRSKAFGMVEGFRMVSLRLAFNVLSLMVTRPLAGG